MGPLKLAAAIVLGMTEVPASAGVNRWAAELGEASARFGLPKIWIKRVMAAESNGRTELEGKPITSRAGAMGLMQLMPQTWSDMRSSYGLGSDPFDPHDNIIAGAAYLRAMYDRFGYPGLFAAYNAGPRRFADYLEKGIPLPAETVTYLKKTAPVKPGRRDPARPRSPNRDAAAIFALDSGPAKPSIPSAQPLASVLFVIQTTDGIQN